MVLQPDLATSHDQQLVSLSPDAESRKLGEFTITYMGQTAVIETAKPLISLRGPVDFEADTVRTPEDYAELPAQRYSGRVVCASILGQTLQSGSGMVVIGLDHVSREVSNGTFVPLSDDALYVRVQDLTGPLQIIGV